MNIPVKVKENLLYCTITMKRVIGNNLLDVYIKCVCVSFVVCTVWFLKGVGRSWGVGAWIILVTGINSWEKSSATKPWTIL